MSGDVDVASFTLRPPDRALTLTSTALLGGLCVVQFVMSLTHRHLQPWFTAWLAVLFVLVVVSAVFRWRTRVTVSAEGVEARTQWGRRRRLSWAEVHHFEGRGYRRGLGVRTVDGRWLTLFPTDGYSGTVAEYVDRLEQYRSARQRERGLG